MCTDLPVVQMFPPLTLYRRQPLCPHWLVVDVLGYQLLQLGGGLVDDGVVHSLSSHVHIHLSLPLLCNGSHHLSRELSTQITEEGLRDTEHGQNMAGKEERHSENISSHTLQQWEGTVCDCQPLN